ncbi:MAG: BatA domain-containing protein [Planctomycetia bacterium]|nr:BatA domain-containing protein [Planctomycetia bacterium]
MEFLNPFLLAGAGLAAVPVVLHLIMRQQPRLLEFPALRFLQMRQLSNRRRMKLRHLLLLALRVAAVCLLALALARPSIHGSGLLGDQQAPTAAAMVFDTSARMAYRHENRTRLEAAQDIALWLLPQLPPESQVAVVDATPGDASFQIDLGTARQRIERLATVGLGRPLPELFEGAIRLLKDSQQKRKEVFLFTDLTDRAWPSTASDRLQRLLAEVPGVAVYVIDVGVLEPRNLSLAEIQLSGQVLARNSPLRVATELVSLRMEEQRTVELYLSDSQGQMQKRSEESVAVTAGGSKAIDFPVAGLDEGTHQGYVRIVGTDALPIDDARYFTVEVKPPWRVLVAALPPADYHAANLTEALAPADFRRSGHARFECDVVPFDDLGRRPLAEYAAVCLLDPRALGDNVWKQLSDFARGGGGVGIFLGPSADLASFGAAAAQELLPGPLAPQARYPDGTAYISTRDDQHPILAKFRSRRGAVPWEDFPVYRLWQFDPLADGVGTVVPLTNGRPVILERPIGKGRVLTMATPVSELAEVPDNDRWNQLWGVGSWPFFTLANEMMMYLVGSTDGQLNYATEQAAVLYVDAEKHFPTYLVSTPSGESLRQAPNQQNAIVVTATSNVGNYRVRAGGEQEGVNLGFSVNLPIEASRLDRIGEDRLKAFFGEHAFRVARDKQQIDREVSLDRVGRELYPLLIGLVAFVLGLEHVLANRFYREPPAAGKE